MSKRNRILVIQYDPKVVGLPEKKDRVHLWLTKTEAKTMARTYKEAKGLGAKRVIIAKIEMDEDVVR